MKYLTSSSLLGVPVLVMKTVAGKARMTSSVNRMGAEANGYG